VEPVRTRDAVADETPASRATSASVGGATAAAEAAGATEATGAVETIAVGVTAFSCHFQGRFSFPTHGRRPVSTLV
jgi:hypothetical protein